MTSTPRLKPFALAALLAFAAGLVHAAEPAQLAKICSQCAIVDSVKSEKRKGDSGLLGMAGGAVVGGLLGNQVGGGRGKTLATVGGAVAGGYAGNEVEKHVNAHTVWITGVTLKNGTRRTFETANDPGFAPGTVVEVAGNSLKRR